PGLYLQADRPVRIGDYVRVDTGDEGTVMHIGWRSTRLRTITNNTVVLPNERLSKAVVTNYSLPDPEVAVDVRVTIAYDSDLDRVERLLAEAARHARAEHPGMLDDPPPAVRLIPGFGPKGLDLTLSVWVRAKGRSLQARLYARRDSKREELARVTGGFSRWGSRRHDDGRSRRADLPSPQTPRGVVRISFVAPAFAGRDTPLARPSNGTI